MIVLQNHTDEGELLEATFLPEKGMNMISYKKGAIEVIDQSTRALFEERYAGLGALIGPHFHRRQQSIIPKFTHEPLFPHVARMKEKGISDPFSHGIGRYAPWQAEATTTRICATLSGKDLWNGIPLSQLEGQNFKMNFDAELSSTGLTIHLSVVSETDSVVGIHYYYALPHGKGIVTSDVKELFYDQKTLKPIPSKWLRDSQGVLTFDLTQAADYAFHPLFSPFSGEIMLKTETHYLHTRYHCPCQEHSWQLYHPTGASFVCIEPISAQNPRASNLTASSIEIELTIQSL